MEAIKVDRDEKQDQRELEIYALDIQLQTARKNFEKVKTIFKESLAIKGEDLNHYMGIFPGLLL